ncbi:MAG: hypothetical protein GC159_15165 [Phycisphaera sp.]|nr:hypothetical protein [Phycisphaera sp.]
MSIGTIRNIAHAVTPGRARGAVDTIAPAPPAPPAIALPFAHLNLRRNPFGEPQRHERGELAVVDIDAPLAALREALAAARPYAVQLIGDCGRGKTTHLLALHQHFTDAPYVYVAENEPTPTIPDVSSGGVLFVDEMQRVPRRTRRAVMRRGAALVIGTHRDHTRELRRAGYAIDTIRPAAMTTVDRLRRIVARRIDWARRAPGPTPGVSDATLRDLLRRHRDNVRAIEAELYERFQRLEHIADV